MVTYKMIKGRVQAVLMLILIPIRIPNPRAAKKDIITRATPTVVTRTRDSTRSQLKRKIAEIIAMRTIEIAMSCPLSSVMSLSN